MAFICYVYQAERSVPYMEAAPGLTFRAAKDFARALLSSHDDALAVEIFHDDHAIARLERSRRPG
jgi:hypothetical protein